MEPNLKSPLPKAVDSSLETPLPKAKREKPKSSRPLKKIRKMSSDNADTGPNDNDEFSSDSSNQLVVYKSETSEFATPEQGDNHSFTPNSSNRGLPSIGAFTVQCATCFKWRLIPTKEKYEEIRQRILQEPFVCERAREWRPDVSCEDPEDISQDGSRLWAIDKPNIALPPPGWERLIRIRGEGGTRFADVYYTSPTGKKLRSMVEIEKYLAENPDIQGIKLSQFSFQIPKPLQQNYVKKRTPPPRLIGPGDGGSPGLPKHVQLEEVNPISWVAPNEEHETGQQIADTEDSPEPLQVEPSTALPTSKLDSLQVEACPEPVSEQANNLEDAEITRDASACDV